MSLPTLIAHPKNANFSKTQQRGVRHVNLLSSSRQKSWQKSALKRFKAKCFQSRKPGHLSVDSYKTEELRLFDLYEMNKKFTYHKPV